MVLHVVYRESGACTAVMVCAEPKHSSGGVCCAAPAPHLLHILYNRRTDPKQTCARAAAMVPQVKKKKAEERASREKQTRIEEQVYTVVLFACKQ